MGKSILVAAVIGAILLPIVNGVAIGGTAPVSKLALGGAAVGAGVQVLLRAFAVS